ncbi:two-component sensor histidine kinase [Paenibacillus sp. CAA11]|uniref:cache domain-containing sensor histidine kinase n=1 Tax=Paenibacillus sp. CAA11 TaxID=1532905 RepID=UPI000D36BA4F|nr:sensor histidine kinase [Paenibacillus sp. CAA11]AWB46444.1 two-component sensor histidine kinase [Paenibacillus sp. CAA11]
MKAFNRLFKPLYMLQDRISRRLVNKLILLFTSIILLIVVSITVISYQMFQKESVSNSVASTSNNLLLVNRNLEDFLDGIEQLSLPQLRYDEIIQAILTEPSNYASRMYLEQYLRSLYFSRGDMEAIYLYLVDEHKYYSITREAYDSKVRSAVLTDIPQQPWYQEALSSDKNRAFQSFVQPGEQSTGYPVDTKNSFMAYHRVLRSIASREPQAVLSFYFNASVKDKIMKDVPFAAGDHVMFLDPNYIPFHVDDLGYYQKIRQEKLLSHLSESPKGRLTWTDDGKRYLVVFNEGERSGWKLVKTLPYSSIYETATRTRNLSILIGLLLLLVAVVLVSLTANAITKPLKKLSHQMRRFSEGTFDAEAAVNGRDEIAYLNRQFNQMVRRTNDLINERYKMKLVEKNAILKALEAEINPHFLYNALQAISTKALKHERFDIADMVDALALTLRYCISGKDRVLAREELEHVGRYLSLQKARFGSRLQVEIEWDESLKQLELPKLSLQSLVENSIKHGLEKVSTDVLIVIRASLDEDQAIISVTDNGPGFTSERLREVLISFEEDWEERDGGGSSIGLKNLNTRLKLLYGEQAGLLITAASPGTELRMIIPQGGNSHV